MWVGRVMSRRDKRLIQSIDENAAIVKKLLQIQVVHLHNKSSVNHTTVQTQSALF